MLSDRIEIPPKRPVTMIEKIRIDASVGPGRTWAILGDLVGRYGAPKGRFIEIKNQKGERIEVAETSLNGFIETRSSWGIS